MTAQDLRRISARTSHLRSHVELAAVGERDERHRGALERFRDALLDAERTFAAEADGALVREAV